MTTLYSAPSGTTQKRSQAQAYYICNHSPVCQTEYQTEILLYNPLQWVCIEIYGIPKRFAAKGLSLKIRVPYHFIFLAICIVV